MKHVLLPLTLLFSAAACETSTEPQATPELATEQAQEKPKSGTDYKAKFGPDYKPGDVGHSKGVIANISDAPATVTIEHGDIHGIGGQPGTSTFAPLGSAELTGLDAGERVEFLVRKGEDDIFRLYLICELDEGSATCLDSVMGG